MRKPKNVAAVSALLSLSVLLAGCGRDDSTAVRPIDQPLERLDSPEARARLASMPAAQVQPGDLQSSEAAGMCGEVIRLSERGRVILDRSSPQRLVVNDSLWQQIPPEARQSIVQCAELMRPAQNRSGRMTVVTGR
jgi:hypothetical protein